MVQHAVEAVSSGVQWSTVNGVVHPLNRRIIVGHPCPIAFIDHVSIGVIDLPN